MMDWLWLWILIGLGFGALLAIGYIFWTEISDENRPHFHDTLPSRES